MPARPARPSFFAAIAAIAEVVESDPRVQSALTFLDRAGMTATANVVREVTKKLPELAEGVAAIAVDQVRAEASGLDDVISRKVSRAIDDALVKAGARTPKEKRLRAGSRSRAAGVVAARIARKR